MLRGGVQQSTWLPGSPPAFVSRLVFLQEEPGNEAICMYSSILLQLGCRLFSQLGTLVKSPCTISTSTAVRENGGGCESLKVELAWCSDSDKGGGSPTMAHLVWTTIIG